MPNRRGAPFSLPLAGWLLAAGALFWWYWRGRPFGLEPAKTADPAASAVPQGTNGATETAIPGNANAATEAAAVLDEDPTRPVWVPDGSAEGGRFVLAGDLAGGLLAYALTGDGSRLEAPAAGSAPPAGSSDVPDPYKFVAADDATIAPAEVWQAVEAAKVAGVAL
jgi:hypothetical protein